MSEALKIISTLNSFLENDVLDKLYQEVEDRKHSNEPTSVTELMYLEGLIPRSLYLREMKKEHNNSNPPSKKELKASRLRFQSKKSS